MCARPTVSVIVPVYNGEKYLAECVDSLLRQTYPHCEILLVDDGSVDSSGKICDRYASEHPNVRVVHKPNGGLSDARNAGIEASNGEWICFVDADDVAFPEMVEALLEPCLENDVPMAQGKMVESMDITDVPHPAIISTSRVMNAVEAIRSALYQEGISNSPCAQIYRADLWHTLRFRKGTWYEDLDSFYRVMLAAGKVAVIPQPVYYYRQHPESFVHTFSSSRADVLDVTDRMLEWMRCNCPELEEAARTRRLSAHINILGLMTANSVDLPDIRRRCEEVIATDGQHCRRNPRAKRSLRLAMTLHRFIPTSIFRCILGWGYRLSR